MAGNTVSRRDFCKQLGIGLLAVSSVSKFGFAQRNSGPPNIIIILADDLGYGDLSSYGAADLQTPNIDALMKAGMRFNQFYANCPVCSPTRAALLTGRYPDVVGVPGVIRTHAQNSWGYMNPDSILLPAMLKRAGYHTGMAGKWHLGLESPNTPTERGFDYLYGFLGDMMDDYYTHRRHGINYMRENDQVIDPEGHATDLFTDAAIRYIRERSESTAPFFLYLAYNAPHSPIQPPEDWLQKVRRREAGITEERAKIVALIEHMDAGIGEVVQALKETGEYENTLLIFTSDNGGATYFGATNGPLRGEKQDMYEGGIRVPMCAVWPDHIEPGVHTDRVGLTMDLYPTACEAAGVTVDHYIEGRSIRRYLLGNDMEPDDRYLVWMRREGGNRYMGLTSWAIRRGNWKLLQNRPMEPFELYNLAEDPREENNLAETERAIFNELSEALRAHIHRAGTIPWQEPRW